MNSLQNFSAFFSKSLRDKRKVRNMRKLFYKIKIMPYFCSVQINYNMMYVKTIKILVILCFCSRVAGQEANPLLNMVGKPYAEYHDTFEHVKDSLLWGDSQGRRAAVRLFEEAAAVDATGVFMAAVLPSDGH